MKNKVLTIASALLLAGISASAQEPAVLLQDTTVSIVDGVAISNVQMAHSGDFFSVGMSIDLNKLDVPANRAVLLTPRLVSENKTDSIYYPSIGIYGRTRYYYYIRNGESMLSEGETSFRSSQMPDSLVYSQVVDYQPWMDGAQFTLLRRDYGCCNALVDKQLGALGVYLEPLPDFFPVLVYGYAETDTVKIRDLKGSAFVDFRVDKTYIDPEYRRNTVELAKIQATIDTVRSDKDVTITSVWLKGFASPESPYSHNTELAIGRTEAIKEYIQQLYHFAPGLIETDYEPENWEGLRAYVEASNIDHRQEILDIIDSDREPDPKEWYLKQTYPKEYRFLLQNCYPALRRTDYRISYTIRSYTDVEEIKRVFSVAPHKLSLNEFYILAQTYEPGSDQFTKVFETAVSIYPDAEIANLNAANAAMRSKDFAAAAEYLKKAGNTPEAIYARGAYEFNVGNYDEARKFFQQAEKLGVKEATATLQQLDDRIQRIERQKKFNVKKSK